MIRIPPSKLECADVCPCYDRQQNDDPTARDEGILMHKAAETADFSILDDEEQARMVQSVLEYIDSIVALHGPDVKVYKEIRLPAADKTNLPGGIIDVLIASSKRVDVADYKFGRKWVSEAASNIQLRCYVAKAFVQFLPKNAPGTRQVTGHLISPRLNDISTAVFDRSVIKQIQEDIRRIEAAILAPFRQPNPSRPDVCAQCAHVTTCPAVVKTIEAIIPHLQLPVPAMFRPGAIVSPEDRSIALQLGEVLKSWNENMRRLQTQFAKEGGEIPLFGLVRKSGSVRIRNTLEVAERLKEHQVIDDLSDLLPVCSTTFAKLVKLIDEDPNVTDTKEFLKELLGDLLDETPEIVHLARSRKKADQEKFLPNPFKEREEEGHDGTNKEAQGIGQPEFLPGISLGAQRGTS